MPTFTTPASISAVVDIALGDIHFVAGDRTDTVVEVNPMDPLRDLDVKAAELVDVEYADGKLTVTHPKLRTMHTRRFGSVKVVVLLPTGSDVQGDIAQGENVVQGVVGFCKLTTGIGDIRVGQAADVLLKTSGGRVIVNRATGQADIYGNGDIRIGRIDAGARVKSIGGHVVIEEAGEGQLDLNAVIGTIEVGVSQGTEVRLDAKTPTGRVRNHLETTGAAAQSGRTARVRARCIGDITVRRAGRDLQLAR